MILVNWELLPLICQSMRWDGLPYPVTVAVNTWLEPARTAQSCGVKVTPVTVSFGVDGFHDGLDGLVVVLPYGVLVVNTFRHTLLPSGTWLLAEHAIGTASLLPLTSTRSSREP